MASGLRSFALMLCYADANNGDTDQTVDVIGVDGCLCERYKRRLEAHSSCSIPILNSLNESYYKYTFIQRVYHQVYLSFQPPVNMAEAQSVHKELLSKEDFQAAIQTKDKYVLIFAYQGQVPPGAEE